MFLFPLIAVGLLLATHALLAAGLGRELYRPWMRWGAYAAMAHTFLAWLPFLLWGREARYAADAWFTAVFTLPSIALTVSALATILAAPLWVPWARALRGRARRAPAAAPAEAAAVLAGPAAAEAAAVLAGPAVGAAAVAPEAPAAVPEGVTRRQLLRVAAFAPPAALLASGPLGVMLTENATMPFVHRLTLAWPNLPPGLDGLRIAQVSDIHIGIFVDAPKLARAMDVVRAERPDLFVVTGDIIDDLRQLPETMEALASVKAPLGSFACLGNHEYYAGLRQIRSAYERSPIDLVVNEARAVKTASGATIEVSAVDYPMGNGLGLTGSAGGPSRYAAAAERALVTKATGGDFRLHLSHHPHGWDDAALRGANLTLSGHTHGGQIAIAGRPIFGAFFKYMRGLYDRGDRKLFVHSGLGHWMPLRINTPAEIAIVTLKRGAAVSAEAQAA